MKQRFSSLDVKVIAHELNQSLVTLRLANVYDLSSRILLFKFAKPNNKKQLVVETGFRCHTTQFTRTTAAAPSAFVARLRKLLRTRRLTSVKQVGTDRILDFQFSDGQYRLFLEFFASGNIILTDADLKILTLSRNVSEGEGQEPQRVGLQYSLDNRQNFHGVPALDKLRVQAALRAAVEKDATKATAQNHKGKPSKDLLKCLAFSITEIPPVLIDHILQSHKFDSTIKLTDLLENDALLDELVRILLEAKSSMESISSSNMCPGYIFMKRQENKTEGGEKGSESKSNKTEGLLYEDFHPFIPYKLKMDPSIEVLKITGYNQTVDEFFSSLEGQKLEMRLGEREAAAKRKLEAAKADQAKRIEGLQEAQTTNMRKAAAIEANVDWVQEAMDAVNGLLAQGMDWFDIGKLVEREKKRNNPVASIIALPLNLAENLITLRLMEETKEEEEESDPFETDDSDLDEKQHNLANSNADAEWSETNKGSKGLLVEINLTLSPWSNAREYYEQRRTAVVKEEKTQQQATRALKNAEQKIADDLRKGLKQEKPLLQPIRSQLWFEKFLWFISSDGYLVLGGKDAHQNEILYKKYLRKGDVYCHADLKGAPSVVIKNNPSTSEAPIPPATLAQAGSLSVCTSEAWDQKAGMGAWWVNADQVSKSAPTGQFLPTGSFIVCGKKNFLPPAQLLLGFGIIFKISEESKAKHVKHRIYDNNSALGSDTGTLVESKCTQSIASTVEIDGEGQEHEADSANASEDDDGYEMGNTHYNPLQRFRNKTPSGQFEEGVQAVSSLQVDDESHQSHSGIEDHIHKGEYGHESVNEENSPGAEQDDMGNADSREAPTKTTVESSPVKIASTDKVGTSKNVAPKRGQKGKAKKIATKYRHQDEEDRLAAEAVIGSTIGQKRLEIEAKAKAEKAAELEAAKERRRAQHHRQQKEIAEHEETRRVMMDDGVNILEAEEAEQIIALDALVGTPLVGDKILEAIPVCAPWNALSKFKYKVKMQPGPVKRGKAVKEVMERWKADSMKKGAVDIAARDSERMWPREVELIKAMKVEEIVNCVPVGKLKVVMSGGGGGKGKGGQKGGGPRKGGQGVNK